MSLSAAATLPRRQPPLAPGWPVLGSALAMLNHPLEFFIQTYQQLGPVFKVRALDRHFTVIAGPEANAFLAKDGDAFLGSDELFGDMGREMNNHVNLVAMDGERHRAWRKIMRPGYSREAFVSHLPRVIELTRATARAWGVERPVRVVPMFRRLITGQLGPALMQAESGEYFDDIWNFFNTMLQVLVMKTRPKLLLRTPGYQRAKARAFEFARQTLDWHRATPLSERAKDLLDDLGTAVGPDGYRPTDDDLLTAALGPFFAGLDTVANTSSFMLYALLKHPQVLARVQAEVDQHFTADTIDLSVFRQMPALHATALETLRRYPVTFTLPRVALQPFEFGGYHFETGEVVYVGTAVTHFMPEFFPEPYEFNIDRYLGDHPAHKQPGKFAPYGLGAHTCLGAGTAEIQLMITLGTLLRTARLELAPKDYELKYVFSPLPVPEPNFKLRVVEYR